MSSNLPMAQSPSGGCVLKRFAHKRFLTKQEAVAFGRLCVETSHVVGCQCAGCAVAFGRLCVETSKIANGNLTALAAASVRLCVETARMVIAPQTVGAAASVRLCVETKYQKCQP